MCLIWIFVENLFVKILSNIKSVITGILTKVIGLINMASFKGLGENFVTLA